MTGRSSIAPITPTIAFPLKSAAPNFTPTVSALPWYAALKKVNRGGGGGFGAQAANPAAVPDPANSPQPAIESINPFIVAPEPAASPSR